MIGKKSQHGGKYIGEGTYGCIFRPNLPCKGFPRNEKYVSKIIANNPNTIADEFDNINKNFNITGFDPDSKYFIVPIHNCAIEDLSESDMEVSDEILRSNPYDKGCTSKHLASDVKDMIIHAERNKNDKTPILEKLNLSKTQIILPYGGKEVSRLRGQNSPDSKPLIESIWKQHLNLIKGIVLLNQNNIYHRDIKSQNIVQDGDAMKFIDMGLAEKIDEDWDSFRDVSYLYWPADFKLIQSSYYGYICGINEKTDYRAEKISKLIEGLLTKHDKTPGFPKRTIIESYKIYKDNWIIDKDHVQNLVKSIIKFMVNLRVDKVYNEDSTYLRTKQTFDVFSLGAFLGEEFKALPCNNTRYAESLKELIFKTTSFDPYERYLPVDFFKQFVKIVKDTILSPEEHVLLNDDIVEIQKISMMHS